jgi:hypothetical protein
LADDPRDFIRDPTRSLANAVMSIDEGKNALFGELFDVEDHRPASVELC